MLSRSIRRWNGSGRRHTLEIAGSLLGKLKILRDRNDGISIHERVKERGRTRTGNSGFEKEEWE